MQRRVLLRALMYLVLATSSACQVVPPYVPPTSGPTAALLISKRDLTDLSMTRFAPAGDKQCALLHEVPQEDKSTEVELAPEVMATRVEIPAGRTFIKHTRSGVCTGAGSFVAKPGKTYLLTMGWCKMQVREEKSAKPMPLERADTHGWKDLEACRVTE